MWTAAMRRSGFVTILICTLPMISGCGSRGQLPNEITVLLPDGTETQATLGSGVISLADTIWRFFEASSSGQGRQFLILSFGPNGELESFNENTIATSIFGSTILFDGEQHDTSQQGLTYSAATYGAETSDANGFTFEVLLNAFFAGFEVAAGTATAIGTFDPDDPDTMTGTFAYDFALTISLPGLPVEDEADEFDYIAHRVVEE